MKESKKLVTHSGIYAISMIASRVASFFLLPLYTTHLTPADYGILAILEVTANYFGIAVSAGFTSAMMRFYYREDKSKYDRKTLFFTSYSTVALIGLIFIVAGGLAIWLLAPQISGQSVYRVYILLTLVTVVIDVTNGICLTLLRLQERPITFMIMSLTKLIFSITLSVYLIAYLQIGLIGFVISGLLAATVIMLLFVPFVVKHAARPNAALAKELINFSMPYIPKGFMDAFIHNMGVICLTLTGNIAAVGVYAVGRKLGTSVTMLMKPFGTVWTPYMYKIAKSPNATEVYAKVLTVMFAVLAYFVLMLAVFADDIIRIMATDEFSNSAPVIFPIALGALFFSLGPSLRIGLNLSKKTKYLPLISGLSILIGFPATYFLAITYSSIGAAIGICITWFISTFLTAILSARYLKVPYQILKLLLISAFLLAFITSSSALSTYPLWIKFLFVLMFPIVLYFTRCIPRNPLS